jgi:leucyl aminopeptidase
MQFELFARGVSALAVDCLVVGIHEENELGDSAHQVDKASAGALTRLVTRGDFTGKLGETMLLGEWPGLAAKRLMLVGQGPKASLTRRSWRRAYSAAVAGVAKTQAASAAFALARPVVKQLDDYHWARAAAELTLAALYRINDLKTSKKPKPAPLAKVLLGPARASARLASALKQGRAIGLGARAMRDLANLPANRCTPSYLADEAQSLAKRYRHLQVKVLDEPAIRREKMGCFLAVTQGSDEPPRFIVMRYRGGRPDDAPIALVGKGITFDTGGISLKDPPAMDEMKFDMSGAASVFGALVAACEMQLKLNVTGIVAACENMRSRS